MKTIQCHCSKFPKLPMLASAVKDSSLLDDKPQTFTYVQP